MRKQRHRSADQRLCFRFTYSAITAKFKLLLEEKHCLHKAHQDDTSSVSKKAAYNNIFKTVQNRLRGMQDSWLSKKAEEIQSFADRKDMKKIHDTPSDQHLCWQRIHYTNMPM